MQGDCQGIAHRLTCKVKPPPCELTCVVPRDNYELPFVFQEVRMGFWHLTKRGLRAKVLSCNPRDLSLSTRSPQESLGATVYTGTERVWETGRSLRIAGCQPHRGSVRVTENRVVKEGIQCLPLFTRTLNTHTCTRIPTTMCKGEPLIFLSFVMTEGIL